MSFPRVWLSMYLTPLRAADGLCGAPAPRWGLYGILIRSAMVSLGWYLPAYLLGRVPASLPPVSIAPADSYYLAAALAFPVLTVASWLLDGLVGVALLRMGQRPATLATILNIDGMGNLVIGPLVVIYDWAKLTLWGEGGMVAWGLAHLVIDGWYVLFVVTALRRLVGAPLWLAAVTVVAWFAATVPLAILFLVG